MPIGDRVKERREALGMTQPELARAVKRLGGSLSQGQISSLENGKVDEPRSVLQLAKALKTTVEWLFTGAEGPGSAAPPARHRSEISPMENGRAIVTAPDPLVVWRSAPNLARGGETLIYKEQAGTATRPIELAFHRDAFAYKVPTDDAHPRYERGQTLLIAPAIPCADNDDCLFLRNPDDNPASGVVRRLIRTTDSHWIVRRFVKDAPEQTLPKAEWKAAWHVFGSYNR